MNHKDFGLLVDRRDNQASQTALMLAAAKGHVEIVNFLLMKGADVQVVKSDNCAYFLPS